MTSSTHSMMTLISEDRLSLTSTNASTDEGISSAEEDQEYSFRLSQELADLALKELGENDEVFVIEPGNQKIWSLLLFWHYVY